MEVAQKPKKTKQTPKPRKVIEEVVIERPKPKEGTVSRIAFDEFDPKIVVWAYSKY